MDKESKKMYFKIFKDKVICLPYNLDLINVPVIEIPCKCDTEAVLGLSAPLLDQLLEKEIELHFNDSLSPIVIPGYIEDKHVNKIIMPMKIEDEAITLRNEVTPMKLKKGKLF